MTQEASVVRDADSEKPGRILIVEDELILAEAISLQLQDNGYEVVGICRDGAECIEVAAATRADLVLMDIRLAGDMSGIEAAAELLARYGMPVIFLTAQSDRATIRQASQSNPYGYLTKPVDAVALDAAVTIALQRARVERRLRNSEERFRLLAETAPIGIFLTDEAGQCTFTNDRWQRITGLSAAAALGTGWTAALHPDDRERVYQWWVTSTERGAPFAEEFRFLHSDGSIRWVRAMASALRDTTGRTYGYVGTDEDITQQREAQDLVNRFHDRVRQLAQRLERARDLEREEVAQLLHETLAQDLVAMQLGLATLRTQIADNRAADTIVGDLSAVAAISIARLRKVGAEYHPLTLGQLGLVATLRNHIELFTLRTRIPVEFVVEEPLPVLTDSSNLVVFRSAQEALTNAAKHAAPRTIQVAIHGNGQLLVLRVADDGVGFHSTDRSKEGSFGLLGLEERLRTIGGTLHVDSEPGNGTVLTVAVPEVIEAKVSA